MCIGFVGAYRLLGSWLPVFYDFEGCQVLLAVLVASCRHEVLLRQELMCGKRACFLLRPCEAWMYEFMVYVLFVLTALLRALS